MLPHSTQCGFCGSALRSDVQTWAAGALPPDPSAQPCLLTLPLWEPFTLQATMLFAELTYTLATEEAERIGVDHVARMTATGSGENSTGKGGEHILWGDGWGVATCSLSFAPPPCSGGTPDSSAQRYQDAAQPCEAHLRVRQSLGSR